ncbi:hypothetical protein BD311DRAFT_660327 [Dichomitus squalens]|uniref:Uncharacterized protein n=1 Tax=Dichomitus squalens TaxID=114155 RepID=A0A4Q9MPR6_9APHY|nr:hypothetical protein BD311DRAFT_660327 [Dichomitus squalens]
MFPTTIRAVPSEEDLIAALQQYARECLPLQRRIQRLGAELNYHIKSSKLKQLNAKYNIPTARKPPPLPTSTTLICGQMANDPHRRRGPNAIKKQLALESFQIPRCVLTTALSSHS